MRDASLMLGAAAMSADAQSDAPPQPPNILFFFPDQLRYDWTGASPNVPVRTPHLDALGEQGVRFTRAYCPAPLCGPARACLAAGKEYDRCGVPSNQADLPLDQPSFYAMLRDAGYHVSGCGKFDLNKGEQKWGLDGQYLLKEWGFSSGVNNAGKWDAIRSGSDEPADPYMKYLHDHDLAATHVADFEKRRKKQYVATFPTPLPEEAYCDNWIGDVGLRLVRDFPQNQPWFLQINFAGPHPPVDITARMETLCRGIEHPLPNRNTELPPETHQAIRQNYSAMVENIDRWVGLYIAALRDRGELDNTLIVFSSDHGEMLGDHDLWGKSKPHEPSVGVPLVMAGPGVRPGHVSDALVSTMDLAATFLESAHVPVPKDFESRSLAPLLRGETTQHRNYVLSGLGNWRVVSDGHFKLVRRTHKEKDQPDNVRLYDVAQDRLENTDLAEKAPDDVARLMQILADEA